MRIEQIKNFIKTVDMLSITKAAGELYITQSVLSKQIAGMEQELKVVLFDRSKAGIRLTPVGVVAYERLSKVLLSYESALHHIKDYQTDVEGTLRITKLSGLKTPEAIPESCALFTKRYSKVTLMRKNQNNGPMMNSIRDGIHDIYLIWKHDVDDNPDLECIPLKRYKVSLAISAVHPLAKIESPDISAFRHVDWITIQKEESYRYNMLIDDVIRNAGFEPKMKYADNLADMIDMIQDGEGVGVVCEGHILHGASSMKFVDFDEIPDWTMAAAWRNNNKNPLVQEFLSILRECVSTKIPK